MIVRNEKEIFTRKAMKKIVVIVACILAANISAATEVPEFKKWHHEFDQAIIDKNKENGYYYFTLLEGYYNYENTYSRTAAFLLRQKLKTFRMPIEVLTQETTKMFKFPIDIAPLVERLNAQLQLRRKAFPIESDFLLNELAAQLIEEAIYARIDLLKEKDAKKYTFALNFLISLQALVDQKAFVFAEKNFWQDFKKNLKAKIEMANNLFNQSIKDAIDAVNRQEKASALVMAEIYRRILKKYLAKIESENDKAAILKTLPMKDFNSEFLAQMYDIGIAPLRDKLIKSTKKENAQKENTDITFAQLYTMPDSSDSDDKSST